MTMLDRQTAKVIFTALCFILVLATIYLAREVIILFVFAILFAHLLDPPVRFLQRHSLLFRNHMRGPAVMEVYLAAVLFIGCMIHGFVPSAQRAPNTLLEKVPTSLDGLSDGSVVKTIGDQYGWTATETMRLKALLMSHREQVQIIVKSVENLIPGLLSGLALVPILAVFFLRDGRVISRALVHFVSAWGSGDALQEMLDEINNALRSYVRTQVILAGLSLAFYWTVLLIFRVPHAVALGLLGAFLEFIPVAGWLITAATILSVAVVTQSHWIWIGFLLLIWRMVQDYVNIPRIMGMHLQIHPLLSIFGIMVGWEIGGIVGVYFSIPVMAVTGVVWRRMLTMSPHKTELPN